MEGMKFNYQSLDILEALQMSGINDELGKADKNGTPGMCLAQIWDNGDIVMGFIPFDKAIELQKLMGGVVGKMGKNGYEVECLSPTELENIKSTL